MFTTFSLVDMKVNVIKNWLGWKHSLDLTEKLITQLNHSSLDSIEICEFLENIEMHLAEDSDPVSNIQEHTLVKLCSAFRRYVLNRQN